LTDTIVLMQPSDQKPNYDFILKAGQKPKARLLPDLGLPKPAKIALVVILAVFVLVIVLAVALGGNNKSSSVVGLAAEAQEIARVSASVKTASTDPNLQALAETVNVVLTNQERQFTAYLATKHQKVSTKSLAADLNSQSDAQISAATQSNTLRSFYIAYLRTNLANYNSGLINANSGASPTLHDILLSDSQSVQTIFNSSLSN